MGENGKVRVENLQSCLKLEMHSKINFNLNQYHFKNRSPFPCPFLWSSCERFCFRINMRSLFCDKSLNHNYPTKMLRKLNNCLYSPHNLINIILTILSMTQKFWLASLWALSVPPSILAIACFAVFNTPNPALHVHIYYPLLCKYPSIFILIFYYFY